MLLQQASVSSSFPSSFLFLACFFTSLEFSLEKAPLPAVVFIQAMLTTWGTFISRWVQYWGLKHLLTVSALMLLRQLKYGGYCYHHGWRFLNLLLSSSRSDCAPSLFLLVDAIVLVIVNILKLAFLWMCHILSWIREGRRCKMLVISPPCSIKDAYWNQVHIKFIRFSHTIERIYKYIYN